MPVTVKRKLAKTNRLLMLLFASEVRTRVLFEYRQRRRASWPRHYGLPFLSALFRERIM